jgi:hypothetical protein
MRIGLYTPNYPGLTADGGIGTYTRALAHELVRLGHAVHVLAASDGAPADDGPGMARRVAKLYREVAEQRAEPQRAGSGHGA